MRTPYLLCLIVSAIVGAGVPGAAQGTAAGQPAAALKAKGREVVLPVTVLKKGKLVTGLTAGDFTLTDNGQAQTIASFTQESSQPFQLGLLVDTSTGMLGAMNSERTAAEKFVGLMLPAGSHAHPGNEAFLIHFDREVDLLEDFTNSPAKLDQQLEQMGPTAAARNNPQGPDTMSGADGGDGGNGQQGRRGGRMGSTTLYDAIYLASNQLMKPKKGRKLLVVFSNGVDRGSIETLTEAMEAAERANVSVYTIYFRGNEEHNQFGFPGMGRHGRMGGGYPGGGYPGGGYPGGGYPGGGRRGGERQPRADGKKIMQEIATRTGGMYFEAKKSGDLDGIYNQISQALHEQYMLTYTPTPVDNDGGWHNIALKAKKKDLLVVTRDGYYAPGGDAQQ